MIYIVNNTPHLFFKQVSCTEVYKCKAVTLTLDKLIQLISKIMPGKAAGWEVGRAEAQRWLCMGQPSGTVSCGKFDWSNLRNLPETAENGAFPEG